MELTTPTELKQALFEKVFDGKYLLLIGSLLVYFDLLANYGPSLHGATGNYVRLGESVPYIGLALIVFGFFFLFSIAKFAHFRLMIAFGTFISDVMDKPIKIPIDNRFLLISDVKLAAIREKNAQLMQLVTDHERALIELDWRKILTVCAAICLLLELFCPHLLLHDLLAPNPLVRVAAIVVLGGYSVYKLLWSIKMPSLFEPFIFIADPSVVKRLP